MHRVAPAEATERDGVAPMVAMRTNGRVSMRDAGLDGTAAMGSGHDQDPIAGASAIPPAEGLFVAKAAHELRGAVGGIELLASALADRADQVAGDDVLAEQLRRLATQSTRVESMAAQLLDLTRFGTGRTTLRRTPVHVAGLLADVVASLSLGPDHVVITDVADDLELETDRLALEQIVGNLVRNALVHGGPTISLDGHVDGPYLVLRVVDDGPGVPEDVAACVFEPFVRGADGGQDGHGLGLAIVAEMVRALHGTVSYEPNRPTGARFSVTLPLR